MQKSLKKKRVFERISFRERVNIENRCCIDKKTITDIAIELDRPKSAISREIGGKPRIGRGKYSADVKPVQGQSLDGFQF